MYFILDECVESNPAVTLKEIANTIIGELNVSISLSTIHNYLVNHLLITLKV